MAITAERLLAGIESRGLIAASQPLQNDAMILSFADDLISSRLVTLLESVNEEFFLYRDKVPLVGGVSLYPIPYRAIGRGIKSLCLTSSSGTDLRGLRHLGYGESPVIGPGEAYGFSFEGDQVRIAPDVPLATSDILVFSYRLPPNKLCKATEAAAVTAVSGGDVTVLAPLDTMPAGTLIDFIAGKSGSSIYAYDVPIVSVGGSVLTFDPLDVPPDLKPGDFISFAGTSPVVNFVPNECYSYLESLVTYRVLQSQGDYEATGSLARDIDVEEKNLKKLLEPRMDGDVKIINNRSGLVRGGRIGWVGRVI